MSSKSEKLDRQTANYFKKIRFADDPRPTAYCNNNAEVDETVIDEVKHEDVPSQPFITEQNVRDEHARKNWTRLKTKVKTRNVLLRMNTSMGFVPDDNRDEDRFHKMKTYVAFFAILGIVCGIGTMVVGKSIVGLFKGPTVIDEAITSGGIFDEAEFTTYGYPLIWFGLAVLVLSLLGTFAIFNELFLYMLIYSILCGLFTLVISPIIIMRLCKYDELKQDVREHLQMWWLAIAVARPSITLNIEREHSCCGWFNVFDYCSTQYMSNIMYDTMVDESVQDFLNDLEESLEETVSHKAGMPDYNYGDDSDYTYSYSQDSDYSYSSGSDNFSDHFSTNSSDDKTKGLRANFQEQIRFLDKASAPEKECDELNEYCACDEMIDAGDPDPPWFDFNCRENLNGTLVTVRDGCFQHKDKYGRPICHLNGCGDIANRKAKVFVLVPIVIVSIAFVISYSIGLYFNGILTYHYYGEYQEYLKKLEDDDRKNKSQMRLLLTKEAANCGNGMRKMGRQVTKSAALGRSVSTNMWQVAMTVRHRNQAGRAGLDPGITSSILPEHFQAAPATPRMDDATDYTGASLFIKKLHAKTASKT